MFCNKTVLPVLGGETIIALCPLPRGATMSIILSDRSFFSASNISIVRASSGYKGVKLSK